MLINNPLKEIVKTINTLFNKKDFFKILCAYSYNDINIVIRNISIIINYYLVTKDTRISYSIEELLKLAKNNTETNHNILIRPSNSFYLNYYKINGLNPYFTIPIIPNIDLEQLDSKVSLFPGFIEEGISKIYVDIKQSIIESFSYPEILYKSILKQPKGKELPLVVGTTETTYYESILEIRLKNIVEEERKTHASITKKVLNEMIGKDSLLVLFPRATKQYKISSTDIEEHLTDTYISPLLLSFIKIPSRYKLLSLCAENKQLRNGELIDINTGATYTLPASIEPQYIPPQYSRYEKLSVTDLFEYTNSEFSGDIYYDIDLIYGQLDSNKSREKMLASQEGNIASIKQRDDISVRKIGDKYEIRNGRHRLLYLKYFYVTNYEAYKKEGRLSELKNYVTIPVNVESSIEDEKANFFLAKLFQLNPKMNFYKINIKNDNPEIIIIFNNRIYALPNADSIEELYNLLLNSSFENKYYLGINNPNNQENYQRIFDYLIIDLKEKIFNMDLLDIIIHLLKEGVNVEGKQYKVPTLNIKQLYSSYVDLQHTLQLNSFFYPTRDMIKHTENKLKMKTIGYKVIDIIKNNPSYIKLSWDELYDILILYQELATFDSDFLKEAADSAGYQKLKLEYLLTDTEYTNLRKSMLK